jgi:hypothetical protein
MRTLTEPARLGSSLSTPRWLVLAAALIATTATACFSATHVSDLQLFAVAIPVPLVVLWRLRRVLVDKDSAVARAEEQASRHALVAEIGQQAIASDEGAALAATACARLGAALGVPVQVVGNREQLQDDASDDVVMVPVGPPQGPRQWLRLGAPPEGGWSPSDLALTHSVANILTTAAARTSTTSGSGGPPGTTP